MMTTYPENYPMGFECIWLATDAAGQVAVFITAGEGPIPKAFLDQDPDIFYELEEYILGLKFRSSADLEISVERPDDLIRYAERGLFVYDWQDIHKTYKEATRSYQLVAIPSNPIISDDLNPAMFRLS
ncbi:hypothetical protein [Mesorhizobium amorphae]